MPLYIPAKAATVLQPNAQTLLVGSTYNPAFIFVLSVAGSATAGATYTIGATTYTVVRTVASSLQIYLTGSAAPGTTSGTLTKTTGTGDATLTYASYNAPAYLLVRMVGGGGGGAGGGNNGTPGAGNAGTDTTFGALLKADKGGGGQGGATGAGGTGGSLNVITAPAFGFTITSAAGGQGTFATNTGQYLQSGAGGSSVYGGGGLGRTNGGTSGIDGTGGGGSGGGFLATSSSSVQSGPGGGAGGYLEAFIPGPITTTISYAVGTGGTGGSAGTGGNAGGNGGGGRIDVWEIYS